MAGTANAAIDEAMAKYQQNRYGPLLSPDDAITAIHSALFIAAYAKVRLEDVKSGKTIEERVAGLRADIPVDVMLSSRARVSRLEFPIVPHIQARASRSQVANAAVAAAYGLLRRAKNGDPTGEWVIVAWRLRQGSTAQMVSVPASEAELADLARKLEGNSALPPEVTQAVKASPNLHALATFGEVATMTTATGQKTMVDRETTEATIALELVAIDTTGNAEPERFMEPDRRTGELVPKRRTREWYEQARSIIADFHRIERKPEVKLTEQQARRAAELLKLFAKDPAVQRERKVEIAMGQPFRLVAEAIEHYFGDVAEVTGEELEQAKAMVAQGFERGVIAQVLDVPVTAIPLALFEKPAPAPAPTPKKGKE